MLLRTIFLSILVISVNAAVFAQGVKLQSPDGKLEVRLNDEAGLSYTVTMDRVPVILDSKLHMELADGAMLGENVHIVSKKTSRVNKTWNTVVGSHSQIVDHYRQVTVRLKQNDGQQQEYAIEFRAYNDGIAFRYVFEEAFGPSVQIQEEHSQFTFGEDFTCWPAYLNSYRTEHQALYPKETLSVISPEDIIGVPLTIQLADDRYCSITEAALTDWAGVYLTREGRSDLLVESEPFVGGGEPFTFRHKIPDGTKNIRIVVDGVDGINHDHVDIADAKLTKANGETVWLSDLKPTMARQEWGSLKKDQSVDGNPLSIGGKIFQKGLGTHSSAVITYKLPDDCVEIAAVVGLDDEVENRGKAQFKLYTVQEVGGENIVFRTTLSRLNEGDVAVKAATPHAAPWRVMMLGRTPADLVNSNLVLNLNEPSRIADPSWIKPGVSSWNWLSCGGKMDMELLKGFIDLSAAMQWEYALIDDGWYQGGNCTTSIDGLDIPSLVAYAKERNVKLWLWVHWQSLDQRLEEAFSLYEKWGIVGIKTDFMSRDDQWMVNWYHKVLESAAAHQLMINFHGSYKPTGVRRTWPNLMTREAIYGEEQNLGSRQNDPVHKTTLPFTRMLAGPMDYTPGSMLNETRDSWSAGRPVKTIGTRCQELAICVIYDSPILTMADKPENYYGQQGVEFLKGLPTSWEETKVLNGQIGEYITTARKTGDTWYLGSITNYDERMMEVPLTFLESGKYTVILYEDGPNADTTDARDVNRRELTVTANDTLTVKLVSGGGFAAILTKRD
jgi:hypothetical protein